MKQINRVTAETALNLARLHENTGDMASSAKLAADDANHCFAVGDYFHAYSRALESLGYSIGKFAADYRRIEKLGEGKREILNVTKPATVYRSSGMGAWVKMEVRSIRVEIGPWAQHDAAVFVTWLEKGKRKERSIVLTSRPDWLVFAGHGLPDMDSGMVETSATTAVSRHLAHDPAWAREARAKLAHLTPILDMESIPGVSR